MIYNNIICFDFETSAIDPHNEQTDVVQIAACAIDSKRLQIIPNSEFNITVRPDDIENPNYYNEHKSTIDFHVSLQKNSTVESVMNTWKSGVPEKQAMKMFKIYCEQYDRGKSFFSKPCPAGKNIIKFDLIILDRLNQKHKQKEFFFRRDVIDLDQLCLYWFMFNMDAPSNYKMDTLRPYFGLSSEFAHDAMFDVKQESDLIIKFLSLHKKLCNQIQFRDCFLKT